jgi:hypothetical protein
MQIRDKQFGEKTGKHASEWGLDPSNPQDREKLRQTILDIVVHHTE